MTNEEVIREIENIRKFNYTLAPDEVFDRVMSALKESRPKGRWTRDGVGLFKCSECGRRICTSISEDNPHNDFPFCHCGADMRGE